MLGELTMQSYTAYFGDLKLLLSLARGHIEAAKNEKIAFSPPSDALVTWGGR